MTMTTIAKAPSKQTAPVRPPDFEGPAAQAWRTPTPDRAAPGYRADWDAGIDSWLVRCPGAHPFWSWWRVDVIHLRDIPGVKPAHKAYPAAEYELAIWTLNPEHPLPFEDGATPGKPMRVLTPQDVCEQFHGVDDAGARRICELAIGAIARGDLSPDQDYRAAWGRAVVHTVAHFRAGKHEVT